MNTLFSRHWFASLALAAFVATIASPAAAMTFRKVDGPDCGERVCIAASGEIDTATAGEFKRFIKRERVSSGAVVFLDSEGGNVMQALALGDLIRKSGMSTRVQAYDAGAGQLTDGGECASACVYAFLGGVERSVARGGKLGVHQLYSTQGDLSSSDAQWLVGLIAVHIRKLGGEMDILMTALRTPAPGMHWLSSSELRRYRVVTSDTWTMASTEVSGL